MLACGGLDCGGRGALRPEPSRGSGGRRGLLRHDGRRLLHPELADPHECGQGQRTAVLRVLRAARRRLDAGDLRLREGRRDHPSVGRWHRLRVFAAASQGRHRHLHGRARIGAGLVSPRLQRRDRSGEARRHASRREHGDSEGRSSRHPRVHRLQAGWRDHELQHLRRGHRKVHGRARQGRGIRPDQSASRPGGRAAVGKRGLRSHRERGVAHRRSRHGLHRPYQRQPRQPDAGAGPGRSHESVRDRRHARSHAGRLAPCGCDPARRHHRDDRGPETAPAGRGELRNGGVPRRFRRRRTPGRDRGSPVLCPHRSRPLPAGSAGPLSDRGRSADLPRRRGGNGQDLKNRSRRHRDDVRPVRAADRHVDHRRLRVAWLR